MTKHKDAHLFVLIHGLWGGPNHMLSIEHAIKNSIPEQNSQEKILVLRPNSFKFWKTYDGLKVNSSKIIREIFYHLEYLYDELDYKVTKISFVGYSLGGLISRYVIGELETLGFFDVIKPIFYSSFATPHLGVWFFGGGVFNNLGNFFGGLLFGQSGCELFLTDKEKILYEMTLSNSPYMIGLKKFKRHILLANIKNDRTVAFHTSYITSYSPFKDWNALKIKYVQNLPEIKIDNKLVKPKFVDLNRSRLLTKEEILKNKNSCWNYSNIIHLSTVLMIVVFILPFWIPLVFFGSFFSSVYSLFKINILPLPDNEYHWSTIKDSLYEEKTLPDMENIKIAKIEESERKSENDKDDESFKHDTSRIAANVFENILNENDIDQNDVENDQEQDEQTPLLPNVMDIDPKNAKVEINFKENDKLIKNHIQLLMNNESNFQIFQRKDQLEFDDIQNQIMANLNSINWIKIPVYIDAWNAHDGIVSRRGIRTNLKGSATIFYWSSILRNYFWSELNESNKE